MYHRPSHDVSTSSIGRAALVVLVMVPSTMCGSASGSERSSARLTSTRSSAATTAAPASTHNREST